MQVPKLIKERILHEFAGKKILERTFQFPDGTTSVFYVGSNYVGSSRATAVIIFALTLDNKVIVVRQFRYGANEVVWELPGGNIEDREQAEETAKKELLEETGFVPGEIIPLGGPIWFDPGSLTVRYLPFLALDCQKIREPNLEETEIMETVLVPLDKWVQMIFRGGVCDAKTIATTLLALSRLDPMELIWILQTEV